MRFKGFESEWENNEIGNLLTIGNGKDYKHLSSGNIPVFGTGGQMTTVNQFLYDGESVFIGRKGTINKPEYFNGKFWTVDTLFFTHSFKSALPKFILYLFQNINWLNYNEASGVPSLSKSTIEKIKVNVPISKEQQKICAFLSKIDARIQTQIKIIKELDVIKDSLIKDLFSDNLRFKDENGQLFPRWKDYTLGDIGDVKMCRRIFNEETLPFGEIPFFKIGSFGKQADAFISRNQYLDYRRRFSYPNKGDILISAAGTIGKTVVYNGEEAYFQDSNIVWINNDNTLVSNNFLLYVLQNVKYNTEGGTIQRLYNNILKSTKFKCPTIEEQIKISSFLSLITNKIELEKRLLLKYKHQKKHFLKNLFI